MRKGWVRPFLVWTAEKKKSSWEAPERDEETEERAWTDSPATGSVSTETLC